MLKNKMNIKTMTKLLQVLCFSVVIWFVASPVQAEYIICGREGRCDLSKRKCVKKINLAYAGGYKYSCTGKNISEEGDIEVTKSELDGKEMTEEEAASALINTKNAKLSRKEKKAIIADKADNLSKQEVSETAKDILENVDGKRRKARKAKKAMEKLAEYSDAENYFKAKRGVRFGDSNIEDKADKAARKINKLKEAGEITAEEAHYLKQETEKLAQAALNNTVEISKEVSPERVTKELVGDSNDIKAGSLQTCATSAQLKARYYSGCWSCFVLEKLTSAFLYAAKSGLNVTQRAGIVLLILCTGIWLMFWGLKTVSSVTEVQLGNILNELLKCLFKVSVAYWFILYSPTVISKYFIRPIMSVGAIIGQQFWADEVVEYTVAWDDVEPVQDLQTIVDEDKKKNEEATSTPVPPQEDEREKELLAQARSIEIIENQKSPIPIFQIPGVPGVITSYPGCRVPPKTKDGKYGSKSHMGLDIGGNNMAPIAAITGGTITYGGNASSGWGLRATIVTQHKGNKWIHLYGHMNPQTYAAFKSKLNGKEVTIGQQIGNVGTTGNSSGPHLHLEVQLTGKVGEYNYNQTYLDPISLGQGKIIPRAFDYNESTKTFTFNKTRCNGTAEPIPDTGYPKNSRVPEGGFCSTGAASLNLSETYVYNGDGGFVGDIMAPVTIPDVTYTGPEEIMPKSIMNSMLGAMRAITNTTADSLILGNMIMCYSTLKDGGAWKLKFAGLDIATFPNIFMWIEGLIVWIFGFLLTMSVAYYFVDISFKIGFAVLSLPVVMGLWPFGFGQDKLFIAISIIAKSSALFAFLAIGTAFGMGLVSAALGDVSEIYEKMDAIINNGDDLAEYDQFREYLSSTLYLFSPTFIMLLFALVYFYKLTTASASEYVNKFFPDKAFGDSSPMHSMATMITDHAKKMAATVSGFNLAKDFVGHQVGNAAKNAGKGIANAALHPKSTAKKIAGAFKKKP